MKQTEARSNINDSSLPAPGPKACRTKPIGSIADFADCLVSRSKDCRYADCPHILGYGYGHFCTHPNWKEFVR